MDQVTFKISASDLEKYLQKYQKFLIENNNQYIRFRLKIDSCTVSFYNSLKVVIQGKNAQTVFDHYFSKEQVVLESTNNNPLPILNDKVLSDKNFDFKKIAIIGSDEVGVGDYFGGLVVAAAIVDRSSLKKINVLNIQDSKKLTDTYMQSIYPQLIKDVEYTVLSFDVDTYNKFIARYKNIHLAKTYLHYKALKILLDKYHDKDTFVVIDEFVNRRKWNEYLKVLELEPIKVDYFKTKAESLFVSVACASIIARVHFLNQINDLSQKVGFLLPLGAWNPKIEQAATKIYEKGGLKLLEQYVKIDFKNTEKIISKKSN